MGHRVEGDQALAVLWQATSQGCKPSTVEGIIKLGPLRFMCLLSPFGRTRECYTCECYACMMD
jgi:hypothetical protein